MMRGMNYVHQPPFICSDEGQRAVHLYEMVKHHQPQGILVLICLQEKALKKTGYKP